MRHKDPRRKTWYQTYAPETCQAASHGLRLLVPRDVDGRSFDLTGNLPSAVVVIVLFFV